MRHRTLLILLSCLTLLLLAACGSQSPAVEQEEYTNTTLDIWRASQVELDADSEYQRLGNTEVKASTLTTQDLSGNGGFRWDANFNRRSDRTDINPPSSDGASTSQAAAEARDDSEDLRRSRISARQEWNGYVERIDGGVAGWGWLHIINRHHPRLYNSYNHGSLFHSSWDQVDMLAAARIAFVRGLERGVLTPTADPERQIINARLGNGAYVHNVRFVFDVYGDEFVLISMYPYN